MPIRKVKARQIFDSLGQPTVEVDLITDIGLLRSSVPCSSLFPGDNEAKEIRDDDEAAYNGRSVLKVVESINNVIAPEILKSKLEVNQQREIDLLMQSLDGTPDKSKLGANAMLGVSVACCKAAAAKRGLPLYRYIAILSDSGANVRRLPVPVFSLMSGGRAAGNGLVYQEFLILPTGAETFAEAMRMGTEIYRDLERKLAELQELKPPLTVADDGAFAPGLEDDNEALTTLDEAIKSAGYDGKVKIALDVDASAFFREGMYDLEFKTDESDPENYLEPEALREQYTDLFTEFPAIVSVEDPFDQDDWDSWSALVSQAPTVQVVASLLTATNPERIEEAKEKQAANCLSIKLGQIGTVTEAIECVKAARAAGWSYLVSAGHGETEDTFIADFAVGVSAGQFKAGAPCRGERLAKYNQILRIEEELGQEARYAGEKFREPIDD
ncbi:enolase-like [Nasonia vitripennis]|uniref:Enolase n=1 Tax=Nasonia vitripennis TaxID=7425 RepID=A0A7M7H5E7_NASVI|nr:enolase-like [Nasonia vitripennis]XP_008207010.1 enolase-like [Nasonia vitripennis]XP_032458185.1 enolase-like [Nasonia vitripennis]